MFYRPVVVMLVASIAFVMIAVATIVVTSWRSIERHDALHVHVDLLRDLERDVRAATTTLDAKSLSQSLASLDAKRRAQNPALAPRFSPQVFGAGGTPEALLERLDREVRTEWWLSLVTAVALPTLTLVLALTFRRRILVPLGNLNYLLGLLARKDYSAAIVDDVDPYLKPLFDRYNTLVERLVQFEREHHDRERQLTGEVRTAARTLLQQQFALARAERLAATGELAARLAHDLRNPLAGVQAALANLREETVDSDHVERLDTIVQEIKGITRLCNDLLRGTGAAPEAAVPVRVSAVIDSVMGLAAYQIPDDIRLDSDAPATIEAMLPESGLHRSLLNLVLNAAQAIGDAAGEIRVGAERRGSKLVISVADDGPGFPADTLRSGTRTFATGREAGTGLGLATVRRFVEDLGGALRLENREPRGALVTMELPYRNTDDQHAAHH